MRKFIASCNDGTSFTSQACICTPRPSIKFHAIRSQLDAPLERLPRVLSRSIMNAPMCDNLKATHDSYCAPNCPPGAIVPGTYKTIKSRVGVCE